MEPPRKKVVLRNPNNGKLKTNTKKFIPLIEILNTENILFEELVIVF